jgi:hypothetical protein
MSVNRRRKGYAARRSTASFCLAMEPDRVELVSIRSRVEMGRWRQLVVQDQDVWRTGSLILHLVMMKTYVAFFSSTSRFL